MTDYSDLVHRLRAFRPVYGWPEERAVTPTPTLGEQAAAALEAQAQRIEWLEEAHRKFEAKYVAELKDSIAVKELAATRIAELERENRRVKNIIYAYEAVRAALKRKRDD